MADATWHAGFARLSPLKMTFEAWLYHPQLMELADLNARLPADDDHPEPCRGTARHRAVRGQKGGNLRAVESRYQQPCQRLTPSEYKTLSSPVLSGAISLEEACRRYELSVEKLRTWQRAIETHGVPGLGATRFQIYRDIPTAGRRSRPIEAPSDRA
jgi:uncharacterized protein DUF1153